MLFAMESKKNHFHRQKPQAQQTCLNWLGWRGRLRSEKKGREKIEREGKRGRGSKSEEDGRRERETERTGEIVKSSE